MKSFHFDKIDSTSDHTKRLLDKGEKTPFLVISDSQSKGRGSYGKKWSSPEGNLYITFCLDKNLERQKQLPLKVGVLIASWLYETFKLKTTIKWPNDILYKSKKIAGILCENHSSNSKDYLCIGIGLNILQTPHLDRTVYYKSSSLNEILKDNIETKETVLSFKEYIIRKIYLLDSSSLLKDIDFFLPAKGTLWENIKTKEKLSDQGLTENGFLRLESLCEQKKETLVSSHSEFRCLL